MRIRRSLAAPFLAAAITAGTSPHTARADTVTDWNQTAIEVMKVAGTPNNPWSRAMAMMHVAMSDAINATQPRYARYLTSVASRPAASEDAAAAAAARQILIQLFPGQKALADKAFASSVEKIAEGAAKSEGIALGEQSAAAVMADRAGDGTSAPDTYRPVTRPGVWVPTTLPVFAQYAQAKPWVMTRADQFRPGPPPRLSSAIYARDYNETKSLGALNSATRTAEQTEAVKFWTQTNFGPAWQAAARQLSAAKGLNLADNARLFALLNMGIANTFIADWDAKFAHNFWRPMTAIRNGDRDDNPATVRDAGWTPLNATPMHPEYPSQAAIVTGVAVGVLESVFGPKPAVPFTFADLADPKQTRTYQSLDAMAAEHTNVRVWGGIHFRNSLNVGEAMGRRIAAYMVNASLRPVR